MSKNRGCAENEKILGYIIDSFKNKIVVTHYCWLLFYCNSNTNVSENSSKESIDIFYTPFLVSIDKTSSTSEDIFFGYKKEHDYLIKIHFRLAKMGSHRDKEIFDPKR